MKSMELLIEKIILSSRWILVGFYLGLVAALAVYAVSFGYKFLKIAQNVFVYEDFEMILAMLAFDRCGSGGEPHRHGDDFRLREFRQPFR